MEFNFSKRVLAYLDLIIRQYKTTNFMNFMGTKLAVSDNILNIDEYRKYLSLDKAIGDALDVLGKRVNIDRYWSGGKMSDDDYRQIIKLKTAVNKCNNSIWQISQIMLDNFGDNVRVVDNESMEMIYYVNDTESTLFDIAVEKSALPKPLGVRIFKQAIPDVTKVFGFFGGEFSVGFSNQYELKLGTFYNGS